MHRFNRAPAALLIAMLLSACTALQGVLPPSPSTPDEAFSLAYSEINLLQKLNVELSTPTVPGATPLQPMSEGRQNFERLAQLRMRLDAAYLLYQQYGGVPNDLAEVREILRVIRAALEAKR